MTKCVRLGPFRSRAPVSVLLSCDCPGALCTFERPICHFLPCGIVWPRASCRTMRGRLTGHIWVGSFRLRAPVSVLLSCDRPGTLCTFRWPVFHFLPCGIVQSGASCRTVGGCPTEHIRVGLFRSRVPILVFLSCDRLGALCTFGQPICHLFPYGIVRSDAPCCTV